MFMKIENLPLRRLCLVVDLDILLHQKCHKRPKSGQSRHRLKEEDEVQEHPTVLRPGDREVKPDSLVIWKNKICPKP